MKARFHLVFCILERCYCDRGYEHHVKESLVWSGCQTNFPSCQWEQLSLVTGNGCCVSHFELQFRLCEHTCVHYVLPNSEWNLINVSLFPQKKYLNEAMKKILVPQILWNQLKYCSSLSFNNALECPTILLKNKPELCGVTMRFVWRL